MQSETDHYSVLRLRPGSSIEEVRRQYRRLAKVYHPDRNPGEEEWCAEQLAHVNLAYEFLSNPDRKKSYDQGLRGQKAEATPPSSSQSRNTSPPRPNSASSPQKTASYARAAASTKRIYPVEQKSSKAPTSKQIATILIGGTGIGVIGALLSMALFNYLHPAESRYTVLPAKTMIEGHKPQATSESAPKHHAHTYHVARELRTRAHEARRTGHPSEEEKLNKLGVSVPANEFSKQEMADMAARLQAYDRSH
jgi:curved DNA-binding protein CbpA